ncbi:MAG: DUF2163 domain-containing protein [Hyphomonadaceae bacterium]|nr:DUF2163 domain-containing protein [Hyphomonadaceae bacterium]
MRAIPPEMLAALESGVTTHAHVWKVVRRDGEVFGFTDHDRSLPLDGLTAQPAQALRAGAIEKSLDLAVDTASIGGVLAADAITESDLAGGVWDGARVDVYRVDWSQPTRRVHLFSGRIGEVQRGSTAFEAELRGIQAPLNVPVGRVFSRFCDAELGDARCGKVVEDSLFRAEGVITALIENTSFRASGLSAYEQGWFARGHVVWAGGIISEVTAHRVEGAESVIELLSPLGAALSLGAGFVIYAGCDKRVETCRSKFNNCANFRGFPHMPGNDAVQARPDASTRMDGSSRFA